LKTLPTHRKRAPVVSLTGQKARRIQEPFPLLRVPIPRSLKRAKPPEGRRFTEVHEPEKAAMVTQFFCATRTGYFPCRIKL
jgi:hypothetical protein